MDLYILDSLDFLMVSSSLFARIAALFVRVMESPLFNVIIFVSPSALADVHLTCQPFGQMGGNPAFLKQAGRKWKRNGGQKGRLPELAAVPLSLNHGAIVLGPSCCLYYNPVWEHPPPPDVDHTHKHKESAAPPRLHRQLHDMTS